MKIDNACSIINLSYTQDSFDLQQHKYYSLGIHPYFIGENDQYNDDFWKRFLNQVLQNGIVAIGEAGLDKRNKSTWNIQVELLERQISIANQTLKPLIIHCVRAFNEILPILHRQSKTSVIFHGIRQKWSVICNLVNRGYYISFGQSLLESNNSLESCFKQVPLNQLFLETDDQLFDLASLYQKAAILKNMDLFQFKSAIQNNFKTIFPSICKTSAGYPEQNY